MTKRVTPAVTAIGAITVSLLVAGGSRLSSTTDATAGANDTAGYSVAANTATLRPDGSSTATLTLSAPASACGGILLGIGAGSVSVTSDNGMGFATASAPSTFATTQKVTLSSSGTAQMLAQATNSSGLQIITATFSGGNCSGTATTQIYEVGTPASVSIDAPNPARIQTKTGSTTVTAHVMDASTNPVPFETVVLYRSSDPNTPIPMKDMGDGSYTVSISGAANPIAEKLAAVDQTASPNLQSALQTLDSVSSNADCRHLGLQFKPGSILADGQSSTTATATFFNGQNAASGEPVTFTGDPGLNITNPSATTDQGGVATATVHAGYSIGNKHVTVTDPNSLISCPGTLVITNGTPGTPGPGQLSRYIYRAYSDVLHRVGEDAGVEYWGNFVNFGGSRGQVALGFTDTQEYLTDVVNGMYSNILKRAGETDGVTYWVGQIQNGQTTDEQLAALFLSSDEFYANAGGGTDSGWVDALYQSVLGRSPDATGKDAWVNALQSGWSRTQVAYAFTSSTEQLTQKVIGYYNALLHRTPNQSDVAYWVNAMQNGVHDENLMAAFIGSDEYFNAS